MQVDQALRALTQLKAAAPPTTSARLGDIIELVQKLDEENARLSQQSIPLPDAQLTDYVLDRLKPSMQLIGAQAEAMRGGKLGLITTEQADCLQLISEHAVSALSLLETTDELGLLSKGLLHIEQHTFNGLDLLAQTWQRYFEAAELREHHLNIHADDPLPSIRGDMRYIREVLCDLLDNAIRYTPFGGSIRITAESLGTHVLFSVADNGIGLNTEDMAQIGQPFWRALYQPLVRQHPGTGLRVYRARQILKLHESELFISGEPSMGSTFSFLLSVG